jgi:NAD(P)-dependent dehydrogenase (short-subunit alcohol dehydrogenase family)
VLRLHARPGAGVGRQGSPPDAWPARVAGRRGGAAGHPAPGRLDVVILPAWQWGYVGLGKVLALVDRIAQPDEIAALLSWLCSAEAANVNGAIVAADGGRTAG